MVISRAAISKKPRTAAPGLTQSWPMRATQPRAWAFTASHSRWHRGANAYLAAQGSALRAADITGVTGQGLLQYLRGGDPVIVWITKDLSAPRTGGCTWLLADTGETYVPYANLHCVVLAGWDGDTCTIADPLQGRRRVDAAAFLQCFRQMGSRAVVVH